MPAAHVSRVRALYRRILLLHRALPPDLKALGDQYVKDEFRRHKAVGADEARRFLQEWEASAAAFSPPSTLERLPPPTTTPPALTPPSVLVCSRGRPPVPPGFPGSHAAAACPV